MTATDTQQTIEELANRKYKDGWVTPIESEALPPGLNEGTIRAIAAKKHEPQWLIDWRLRAYRHWQTMTEPTWQFVKHRQINYQDIIYYSAPKQDKDKPPLNNIKSPFKKINSPPNKVKPQEKRRKILAKDN